MKNSGFLYALISPESRGREVRIIGLTYETFEPGLDLERTYQVILKLDPKNSTANYRLGLSNYYNKNYVQAKKYFNVVINLYPFDYNGTLMSVCTNYFLGNMSEAKVLFIKVLIITPYDSNALERLGLIK